MNLFKRGMTGALTVIMLLGATGCPVPPTTAKKDGGPVSGEELILSRVGSGTLYAHPGDVITLLGLLAEKGTASAAPTPIGNTSVTWKFTQLPGPATFSSTSTDTGADGVAKTVLTIGDGFSAATAIVLRADAQGATSTAVWEIQINPIQKRLKILANPPQISLTNSQGTTAAVNGVVGIPENLQVEVLAIDTAANGGVTQTPVANENLTFTFANQCAGAAFVGGTGANGGGTTTNASGVATLTLDVGSGAGCTFTILAVDGNVSATFTVTVSAKPPTCMESSQCGNGWVCISGECAPQTAPPAGTCNGSDLGCPIGYVCNPTSGACDPLTATTCGGDAGMCPTGFECVGDMCQPTNPQCTMDSDCPNGTCRNGICYPNGGTTIDITGHWYTAHEFNVQQALPSWFTFSGEVIRILDQILMGQISGLPSIVNDIIAGLVQQYIPSWVVTVVYILDNIFTIFSDLRAAGEMDLTAINGNLNLIQGQEYWDHFIFFLLSQCGGAIAGNPTVPPPCAEVDVYTTQLNAANLSTTVNPFTGTVSGGPSPAPFTFNVNNRTADLSLAGIVLYVINQVISTTTGYPSLQGPPGMPQDGALYNLVDCAGLAALIESIIPIDTTAICQAFVAAAADVIAQQLNMITVNTNVLSFYGHATAQPTPGNPTYAGQLGFSDNLNFVNPRTPADGVWTADFLNLVGNVPGRWYANRTPFPIPTQ